MGALTFNEMLDKCVKLGVEGVEMTGGGWSSAPHFRADELLADKGLLRSKLKEIESRGLRIAALNCSGNPLDPGALGEKHRKEIEQTIRLAGEIGVKKIVTMSGLPAAAPGDTVPNWLVYTKSWPAEMPERLDTRLFGSRSPPTLITNSTEQLESFGHSRSRMTHT